MAYFSWIIIQNQTLLILPDTHLTTRVAITRMTPYTPLPIPSIIRLATTQMAVIAATIMPLMTTPAAITPLAVDTAAIETPTKDLALWHAHTGEDTPAGSS